MISRIVVLRVSCALLAGTLAASSVSVLAQQSPSAPDESLTEVVVTGSRISRTDAETPSPVQIVTAEDLKESGYTTVSEVLRNMTANGAGTLSNAFPGAFAGGATGVSLRGLNTSATLVLIDGHRMAPYALSDDGQRSFVDVSSIPFDAVERVEVLKDGASAAYGSDAMAGVVNVILKRKVVGSSISAEAGTATEGGGTTEHATVMHGMGDLDSDGYNAYINLEYRHQSSINQVQRQGDGLWSDLNQTALGGDNQTPGVVTSLRPIPPAYGTVYITPLTGSYSAANSYFYANPIKPSANYTGTCTYALQQTGGCAFYNPRAEIQPDTKNYNGLLSFSKKLGDTFLLDVKTSWFNSQGEQYAPTATANGLRVFPTIFNPIVATSAFTNPVLVGATIPAVTVPEGYPGNPFPGPAKVRGVDPDAPDVHTTYDSNSYRFVADLTGEALGWKIDGSIGWSQVEIRQSDYGATDTPVLDALLNNTANPYLITGGNSAAYIAAVYPVAKAVDTSTLMYGEFNASHSLFKLPGGDLAIDVGGQYINRFVNAPAPDLYAEGITSGNNAYVIGKQIDTSAFAELAAPITSMLEVDAHARFDHFNISGNATTPSLGVKFTPIKQFAVRGTYGQGFRAPNPAENGNAGQGYSAGTLSDPVLCPGGGTAKGDVISQCNYAAVYQNASNPKLKPEKSKSETVGIVVEPFRAWSTTLDFYQVKIDNQIVAGVPNFDLTVRGAPVVETCSNGTGGTYTCTTPVGEAIYTPVEFVNANSTKVNGLELTTRYRFDLGVVGNLTADFDWSHTTSYQFTVDGTTYQLAGTHGPAVIGGNTGNPKDRIQANFTWDKSAASVRLTFNYVGSFDLTDPSGSNAGFPVPDCPTAVQAGGYTAPWFTSATAAQPNNNKYCRVQQFLDTDLYAQYKLGQNLTLHASMLNVFNQQPPLDLNTYGGGNLPYNPSMHQAGAVGRFLNAGFIFAF